MGKFWCFSRSAANRRMKNDVIREVRNYSKYKIYSSENEEKSVVYREVK